MTPTRAITLMAAKHVGSLLAAAIVIVAVAETVNYFALQAQVRREG